MEMTCRAEKEKEEEEEEEKEEEEKEEEEGRRRKRIREEEEEEEDANYTKGDNVVCLTTAGTFVVDHLVFDAAPVTFQ